MTARPHRADRSLLRPLAVLFIAGALAGCNFFESPDEPDDPARIERTAIVTGAFEAPGGARELAFLPDESAPGNGMLAAAGLQGGLSIFNMDGRELISASGPRLRGLAGIGGFPLRGETLPLVFGMDENGALRGYAVVRAIDEVIELPLEGDLPGGSSLCLYGLGIGYIDLAILADGDEARIVRLSDGGGQGLSVRQRESRALPFPARSCARAGSDLLVAGPTAGIARVDERGETRASSDRLPGSSIAYSELLGRPAALMVSPESGLMDVLDARSLELITRVRFEAGLGAPGFDSPSALALTDENFGGGAFSNGVAAAYDRADGRIKLIAREVITRTTLAEDS
ncbi:hypothetical protein F1654_12275 [Alkalicaulis satelles]|uniref:BPP domain-containing protein n=1 Tax=Alkalicaulis satelles TaxID=2609175 RepID=A0A5M6ZAC4_9PROT|nr:hypothetical protein [Alkalicaulis satelles]KAA5801659.1 hypothetical protein F1654_12275 [Alkalicaulis satelles]